MKGHSKSIVVRVRVFFLYYSRCDRISVVKLAEPFSMSFSSLGLFTPLITQIEIG